MMQDTLFDGNYYGVYYAYSFNIDNIIVQNTLYYAAYYLVDVKMSNSLIRGTYSSAGTTYPCFYLLIYANNYAPYFVNNTIDDCYRSYLYNYQSDNTSVSYVAGNTFMNNYYALDYYHSTSYGGEVVVEYNNFINNTYYNLYSRSYDEILNVAYNYWGQGAVYDASIIADTIYDVCDGSSYPAIAQFWPWLQAPYTDDSNLPDMYTIDATTCSQVSTATAYIHTPLPTVSPTADPTTDPTPAPTTVPTDGPTPAPTPTPTAQNGVGDQVTTADQGDNGDDDDNDQGGSGDAAAQNAGVVADISMMGLVIIGSLCAVILCLCCAVIGIWRKYKAKEKKYMLDKHIMDSPANQSNANINMRFDTAAVGRHRQTNEMVPIQSMSNIHGVADSGQYDGYAPQSPVSRVAAYNTDDRASHQFGHVQALMNANAAANMAGALPASVPQPKVNVFATGDEAGDGLANTGDSDTDDGPENSLYGDEMSPGSLPNLPQEKASVDVVAAPHVGIPVANIPGADNQEEYEYYYEE